MEITVRGKHGRVSEPIRRHAVRKLGHLGKFLSTITSIDVHISQDGHTGKGEVVHITVKTGGPAFRARGTSSDARVSIDMAAERLERRLKEFKRRRSGRPLHASAKIAKPA